MSKTSERLIVAGLLVTGLGLLGQDASVKSILELRRDTQAALDQVPAADRETFLAEMEAKDKELAGEWWRALGISTTGLATTLAAVYRTVKDKQEEELGMKT